MKKQFLPLDNSRRAFTAFLSFDQNSENNLNKIAFDKLDAILEKNAGIDIYQPTPDNVEEYIDNYLRGELRNANLDLSGHIQILISSFSDENSTFVRDASGVAEIAVGKHVIELPFIILDGAFVPFDVIQVENQRVPYSCDNLRKVAQGLMLRDKEAKDAPGAEFRSFIGTAPFVNSTSSVGFLGDVLRIQEQHGTRGVGSGNFYVTAAERMDQRLEKIAGLKQFSDADWAVFEQKLFNRIMQSRAATLEKNAEELAKNAEDSVEKKYQDVQSIPWKQAYDLPHGTTIHFPVIHKNELTMKKGLVLSQFLPLGPFALSKKTKVVLSEHGDIMMLQPGDKFLCVVPSQKVFLSLPQVSISSLRDSQEFMAFDGGQAIPPVHLRHIRVRQFGPFGGEEAMLNPYTSADNSIARYSMKSDPHGEINCRILTLIPLSSNQAFVNHDLASDVFRGDIRIAPLSGVHFASMPYEKYIQEKSAEMGMANLQQMISSLLTPGAIQSAIYNEHQRRDVQQQVIATDPETKVILITGLITGFLTKPEEITDFESKIDAPDLLLTKQASADEYIEIVLADKEANLYNMNITFVDRSTKMEKIVRRQFKKLPYSHVREVLKACNFSLMRISELLAKAKSGGSIRVSLPSDATPDMLSGAALKGQIGELMKKVRTAVFNPGFTDQMSQEVLGRVLAITPKSPLDRNSELAAGLQEKKAQAAAISALFEKQAIEQQSDNLRRVAAVAAFTAHLDGKLSEVFGKQASYPQLKNLAKEVLADKEYLEKMAYDLIALKVDEMRNKNEIVPVSRITGAIKVLDHLHKVATYLAL